MEKSGQFEGGKPWRLEISRWSFWLADCSYSLKIEIEAHPVNSVLYTIFKHHISFVANFNCSQFVIMARLFLSFCAPPSEVAVQFDLNLPFSRTGERVNFAVLYRIWFGTYLSVPMPYFYSETNEWSKHWAKQRSLLWSVTCSRKFHWKFRFRWEKTSVVTQPHASRSKFSRIKSALQEWWHFFLKRACSGQQWLLPTRKCSVFILTCQTKLCLPERCPKSLATEFAVKPSIIFWNSLWKWLRWTQTWELAPEQWLGKVLSIP